MPFLIKCYEEFFKLIYFIFQLVFQYFYLIHDYDQFFIKDFRKIN